MGLLSSLIAPAAQVVAGGAAGYEQDQQTNVARALAAHQQAREDLLASIKANLDTQHANFFGQRATDAAKDPSTVVKGIHIAPDGTVLAEYADGTFAPAPMRGTAGQSSEADGGAPRTIVPLPGLPATSNGGPEPEPATPTATPKFAAPKALTPHSFMVDGKPTEGFVDPQGGVYDSQHQPITGKVTPYVPPVSPTIVPTAGGVVQVDRSGNVKQLVGPDGKPVMKAGAAGVGVGNLPAPLALKVSQYGELLRKTADLLPMMDKLNVTLGGSAAADVAEHGVHIPIAGVNVPGTQGLGSMMLNNNPDYAQYQAALSPAVIAAAHAQSGARYSAEQGNKIQQSIESKPGDFTNPGVLAQKKKNILDLLSSIGSSLPRDAIAAQEAQAGPAALNILQSYGYKPFGGSTAPASGPQSLVSKYGLQVP